MPVNPDDSSSRFFDALYGETPPWEVGQAQPALVALFDEYPPAAPVFDPGCGTGDLALELARRGLHVLGVDFAPTAIDRARAKAADTSVDVGQLTEFVVGDALHPTQLPGPFGTVVDSGFFHLFGPEDRAAFARELAASLVPGGRYYLLGFAIEALFPNGPKQVREDELRSLFAPEMGWRLVVMRPALFTVGFTPAGIPAVAAVFERLPAE